MVHNKLKLGQWRNTKEVITWFESRNKKLKYKFIQFDVVKFYPSISVDIVEKVFEFYKTQVDISSADMEVIKVAAQNILYNNEQAWCKKSSGTFDVTMGGFAAAELCEAVGLWLLNILEQNGVQANLYRDDGLLMSHKPPRAVENIKKLICKVFKEAGLNITIEANLNTVDFLDITLNLEEDTYEPYTKPNNVIQYVNANSNHPKNVLDNIPIGIEKRVNELSKNEFLFNKHKDTYQEVLSRAGYNYIIKYTEKRAEKKTNRQRKVIYFNPYFFKSMETNIVFF